MAPQIPICLSPKPGIYSRILLPEVCGALSYMLLSLYTASSLPPPHHVPIMAVIFSGLGNCKSLTFQFSLPRQPTFHTAAKMNSYCQSTLPPPFNGLPLQLGQGRLLMTCPCYSIQLISCFWYNVLSSLTQTVCVFSPGTLHVRVLFINQVSAESLHRNLPQPLYPKPVSIILNCGVNVLVLVL